MRPQVRPSRQSFDRSEETHSAPELRGGAEGGKSPSAGSTDPARSTGSTDSSGSCNSTRSFDPTSPVPRRSDPGLAPLSFAQERFWLLDQLFPQNPSYSISVAARLSGPLDAVVLEKALGDVIERHDVLRTTFSADHGEIRQVIARTVSFELPLVDLSPYPENARNAVAERLMGGEANRSFVLGKGPLLRGLLLALRGEEHILVVTMAHIISDASSFEIFFREMAAFYCARLGGSKSDLSPRVLHPPLPVDSPLALQFGDFTAWTRERAATGSLEAAVSYWKQQLGHAIPALDLPFDRPRPKTPSFRGRRLVGPLLSPSIVAELKVLAGQESCDLFTVLLAAFQVLLHRTTGQEDISVGSAVTLRDRPEFDGLIGCFVNTLVLRSDLSRDPTFKKLLERVGKVVRDAHENREVPFERIVEAVHPERSLGMNPLFQVAFSFQNAPAEQSWKDALRIPGVEVCPEILSTQTAKFDLTLELVERPLGLALSLEWCSDLFDESTVVRLLDHYRVLLCSIASNPNAAISKLAFMDEEERRKVVVDWNATDVAYPDGATIHQLFEARAAERPESIALIHGSERMTYGALNHRANRLAHVLIKNGVGPNSLVGVCLHRSFDQIVSLLAVLKAGGAYVPLDPESPRDRIAFILGDGDVRPLLATRVILEGLAGVVPPGISIAVDAGGFEIEPSENPASRASSADAAYVNYTSGSTGTPKGVVVPHRAISRLLFGVDYADFGENATLIHLAPIHFDASTYEIWGALVHGGRTVLFPERVPSGAGLARAIEEHGVTSMFLTTALFNAAVDEDPLVFSGVPRILVGGEALSVSHVRKALAVLPNTEITNAYGPTECTTFATSHPIPRTLSPDTSSIPIGRPIANTRAYVLDRSLAPLPIGVVGELFLGGPGLACGYLNRPELTRERFIEDHLSGIPGGRLYKTGDRVRWSESGDLEFLGRADRQVKIRGFRIEPGEIEFVLLQHPAVEQVAVTVRDDMPGGKALVAYVVSNQPSSDPSSPDLRGFLKSRLPEYMVPSAFVRLPSLPLTESGKIDHRALPMPDRVLGETKAFVPPRNEVETELAKMWAELIGLPRVGTRESFFDLGGHSLLAVRLFSRIHERFQAELPLSTLFCGATIEDLAKVILGEVVIDTERSLVALKTAVTKSGPRAPFYCVHGIGGEVVSYQALARGLPEDQPFYGFQAPGRNDEQPPISSIEEMADRYLSELLAHQPSGPYLLGGYSFGAIVAYEMAQRLHSLGHEVPWVVMIDLAPPNVPLDASGRFSRVGGVVRRVPYWVHDNILSSNRKVVVARTMKRLGWMRKTVINAIQAGVYDAPDDVASMFAAPELPERYRRLYETHFRALKAYELKPYPGRALIIRSRSSGFFRWPAIDFGWSEFVRGGVEARLVPGGHGSMLVEPQAKVLADSLFEYFRFVRPPRTGRG